MSGRERLWEQQLRLEGPDKRRLRNSDCRNQYLAALLELDEHRFREHIRRAADLIVSELNKLSERGGKPEER